MMLVRRMFVVMAVAGLLAGLSAVALADGPNRVASAKLHDTSGTNVGVALFHERQDGSVDVFITARGLTPGEHGVHVHAVGACAPDFGAAGSHFNPTGALHPHHAGDLGNITAGDNGVAHLWMNTTSFTLSSGPLSLADGDGSALIIHEGPDDLHTHPTGNSGGRVACGVIAS